MFLELKKLFISESRREDFSVALDWSTVTYSGCCPFSAPVRVSGTVSNTSGIVRLSYRAETRLKMPCDRCATETEQEFSRAFEHVLVTSLNGEDTGEFLVVESGYRLNLDELVLADMRGTLSLFFQQYSLPTLFTILTGYLLGSVNFSIIVTNLYIKKDIRNFGSGNAGATNVLRSVGKVPALLTFAGDFAKQVAAILLGKLIFTAMLSQGAVNMDLILRYSAYLAGISCFLGHIYPVFFHFRGGKGVTTAAAMKTIPLLQELKNCRQTKSGNIDYLYVLFCNLPLV